MLKLLIICSVFFSLLTPVNSKDLIKLKVGEKAPKFLIMSLKGDRRRRNQIPMMMLMLQNAATIAQSTQCITGRG